MATKLKTDEILTADQAAQLLKVTTELLLRETAAGNIPARRLAGDFRYSRRALLRWVRSGRISPQRIESPDPGAPWTPEKEAAVEAEIAELYACRRSLGTVGDVQDEAGGS